MSVVFIINYSYKISGILEKGPFENSWRNYNSDLSTVTQDCSLGKMGGDGNDLESDVLVFFSKLFLRLVLCLPNPRTVVENREVQDIKG